MINLQEMYPASVNSVATTITGALGANDTTIYVLDDSRIPDPPNLLVLGEASALAETVKLLEKEGTKLMVQRGFQGAARAWSSGTTIARNFTAYDHDAFKANVEKLSENAGTLSENIVTLSANAAKISLLYATSDADITAVSNLLKDGALIIRAPARQNGGL